MWTWLYGVAAVVQFAVSFPLPLQNTTTNPRAPGSAEILDLIMKIAERPSAWHKIHRVLETLEANKLAYGMKKSSHAVSTSLVNSTTAGLSPSESSSEPTSVLMHPQWQFLASLDHLSALETLNRPHRFNIEKPLGDEAFVTSHKKKTFEQSLQEIEDELHAWATATKPKLKLPTTHAHNKTRAKIKMKHKLMEKAWLNWKKNKTAALKTFEKSTSHPTWSRNPLTITTTHPRFVYHRVIANANQHSPLNPRKAKAAFLAIAIPPKSNSSQRIMPHH